MFHNRTYSNVSEEGPGERTAILQLEERGTFCRNCIDYNYIYNNDIISD